MAAETTSDPAARGLDGVLPVRAGLMIGGEWADAQSGRTFETLNPATGQVITAVAEGDAVDADRAVRAARHAFESGHWGRTSPADRAAVLRRWAELLGRDRDELARLEVADSGMTVQMARGMIAGGMETILHFAGAAQSIHGVTPQTSAHQMNYSLRDPVGVVASIIPWNAPITNAIWKLSPALAAGNTVVLKPAELTPLSALRLAELLIEAGLPDGVVNVVPGFGHTAGARLAEHPGVDKVSFTGSTKVGKHILRASAGNLKHVSLELGGKSPNIVFEDADLDVAVPTAVAAFTTLTGQICTAGSRLFVQRSIHDEFVAAVAAIVSGLTVGDPQDEGTNVGPLVSQAQHDRVARYLALGREDGAVPAVGGAVLDRAGYFVAPTVFTGVGNGMRIAQEEIFGPVVSVIPFDDEDEALALANDTRYGLASALWTRDLGRANRMARRLQAGTVWVNTWGGLDPTLPFGGYKESGVGREFGLDWYHAYTENKAVYISL